MFISHHIKLSVCEVYSFICLAANVYLDYIVQKVRIIRFLIGRVKIEQFEFLEARERTIVQLTIRFFLVKFLPVCLFLDAPKML